MQTTLLPVERILSLAELTAGKVLHPQGVYNMGLAPALLCTPHTAEQGYFGIFRNCTRNMRTQLGWPAMPEGSYANVLYCIQFDRGWNMKQLRRVSTDATIHDVRLSGYGFIGCEKIDHTQVFYPVELTWCQMSKFRLNSHRLTSQQGKNWNHLPANWYDSGWMDNHMSRYTVGATDYVDCDVHDLRGSAPYFYIGDRMITTYHTVVTDDAGRRGYFQYFAELEPSTPFAIKRLSTPFKLGRGDEGGRVQFLMACFHDPDDGKKMIVSFGEADADNCVGKIKKADILGLLL